jgi:EAL domain-containing protein (putative c-di-GMP-specific phosphodiesterase class I)
VLKIDKSFVDDVTTNSADAAIALSVISLAHNLNMRVIAEGVETREQVQFLTERGCDEMQGYYFSRPVNAEGLARCCANAVIYWTCNHPLEPYG